LYNGLLGFKSALEALSTNGEEPFALVLFDIDGFKQVNDKYGSHAVGDEALISIAKTAAECVKGKGSAFRLHGDEFALLLPNHTRQEAAAVSERLRIAVNGSARTSQNLILSISAGVAEWPADNPNLEELLKAADRAQYDSKKYGKNLVRIFGEAAPPSPGPREPERKQGTTGELTPNECLQIRKDWSLNRLARCPRDEAILDVEPLDVQQARTMLSVNCPFCGINAIIE
jgi:diguanylate cyclase (GGDEF)-like protein